MRNIFTPDFKALMVTNILIKSYPTFLFAQRVNNIALSLILGDPVLGEHFF